MKVTALATVLAGCGLVVLRFTVAIDGTDATWALAVTFVAAFAVSEATVFHLEIKRHAHTFSLGEAVLVIGLFFVQPWLLVATRLVGAVMAMGGRRIAPVKILFNAALATAEIATACMILSLIHQSGSALSWSLGALVAVAAADLVGVGAVWTAIAIFDGKPNRRQLVDVFQAQMFVTAIAGSLGVVGALALNAGHWSLGYLLIIVFGMIGVFRKYADVTGELTSLRMLHDFSRSIADDLDYSRVYKTAITDLADVLSATTVSGVTLRSAESGSVGMFRMIEGDYVFEPLRGAADAWEELVSTELSIRSLSELEPVVRAQLGAEDGQFLAGEIALRDDDQMVIVATKSETSVGRFGSEQLEEFESMMSYVSATMRNGIMVEAIDDAARRDDVSGLISRAELERLITDNDSGVRYAAIVLTMVGFGDIANAFGHGASDELVRSLAARVTLAAADDAVAIARLEGATFAILLDAHTHDSLTISARQVVLDLEGEIATPFSRLEVRCQAGLAVADERSEGDDLVRRAHLALSEAERSGEDVAEYSKRLDDAQQRRLRLVGDLRRSIAADELELWYQPKLSLLTGDVVGVEALIRWQHPLLGSVSPNEFIVLAETTGSIGRLTEWILNDAMRQARNWRGRNDLEISVNLSAIDLVDDELAGRVASLLSEHGLSPSSIGFEITETAIMQDRERVVANLDILSSEGHCIYIDDFGTGHSSLGYLSSLPVNALKIDRSFVVGLGVDSRSDAIVSNTIRLAHDLGLHVVAEGVEDRHGFDRLRDMGCEHLQGFFLARPMPANAFEHWLSDAETLKTLLGFDDLASESHERPSRLLR